jgi:hypothetical protein
LKAIAKGATMNAKSFSLVLGAVFIVVGILGFVPGITQMHHADDPNLRPTQKAEG